MSYAQYLKDLMNLWQSWAQSTYMRKYLYLSLGLVLVVGLVLGASLWLIHGALSPLGIPLAFLLISGFDWNRRRKMYQRSYAYARDNSHYSVQMEEEYEDEDHPEEFDDLDDTQEMDVNDDNYNEYDDQFADHLEEGPEDRMNDDETHN